MNIEPIKDNPEEQAVAMCNFYYVKMRLFGIGNSSPLHYLAIEMATQEAVACLRVARELHPRWSSEKDIETFLKDEQGKERNTITVIKHGIPYWETVLAIIINKSLGKTNEPISTNGKPGEYPFKVHAWSYKDEQKVDKTPQELLNRVIEATDKQSEIEKDKPVNFTSPDCETYQKQRR